MNWLARALNIQNNPAQEDSVFPEIEKFGDNLTPNLRALRLTMTVADVLLSMGVSANSVVSRALDVTETYCKKPVHIDISSNVLMVSQLRGLEKEPLTLIRPVALRSVNYMTVQAVQQLIYEIHTGELTLEQAENRLDKILQKPQEFPSWAITLSCGLLVAGVTLMYTSSWQAILTTFIIGMTVERIIHYLSGKAIVAFFQQVAAAAFVALTAATIKYLGDNGVSFFEGMNPTLIVVGGIIMLLSGLAVVGAVQDAIEEYHVTATARLSRVFLQTIGIVVGIMIGLYAARKLGIGIAVSPNPLLLNTLNMQIFGGAVASIGYALSSQTSPRAIAWVGLVGAGATWIMYSSINWLDISFIAASGIAAVFVGMTAAFMSRFWKTPSVGIIAAGILPLVPGLMLYNGLMQLINFPPGNPQFFTALGTLFNVGAVALSIAAGASLGSIFGRPFRQKVAADRNIEPFVNFLNWQIKPRAKRSMAGFVLGRHRVLTSPEAAEKIKKTKDDKPEDDNPYSA